MPNNLTQVNLKWELTYPSGWSAERRKQFEDLFEEKLRQEGPAMIRDAFFKAFGLSEDEKPIVDIED